MVWSFRVLLRSQGLEGVGGLDCFGCLVSWVLCSFLEDFNSDRIELDSVFVLGFVQLVWDLGLYFRELSRSC